MWAILLLVLLAAAVGIFLVSETGKQLIAFGQDSARETKKVVWPSRKETWITSVMVFIMVIIASIFFWIVDTGLGFAFRYIIALGS